ncbi:MAG TPA: FAD-binding oxidoreductase [Acidothermaceae bacterium]
MTSATNSSLPGFSGPVITPSDESYEHARQVWNVMHDRRPAIIAKCTSVDDVVAAIAYARSQGLLVAVRGGGHSLPGLSVCDDGIVVDLRLMNAISVDPVANRAVVQAGALLGEVDRATQQHGLVVPAGVISHTGVAGLTLGGGVGRLMRRFGLTVDSLVSADIVTADGQQLTASADENADLFWALRGGGGNFGVVTSFEFALHELSELAVLSAFHTFDDAHALLQRAQQMMSAHPPDEFLWTSFVRKAPVRPWLPDSLVGTPGVVSVIEWSGDPEVGVSMLGTLRDELAPVAGSVDVIPFGWLQTAGDVEFGHGMHSYVKATFASGLSGGLADVLVERGKLLRSPLTQVELLSMGGAIDRVAGDATAFPYRDARWLFNVPASWADPADSDYEIGWVRDTFAAIQPFSTGGAYSNFMDGDETSSDQVAYGSTLRRLQAIKAVYDPENIFRLNQNITPVPA